MRDRVWRTKEKGSRLFLPYGLALCFHLLLIFLIAQHEAPDTVYFQDNSVFVTLVEADKFSGTEPNGAISTDISSVEDFKESQAVTDFVRPEVDLEIPDTKPKPETEESFQPDETNDLSTETTASSLNPGVSGELSIKPEGNQLVPYNPRWRLKPGVYRPEGEPGPNADPVLNVLDKSIDCFGFEVDCAAQRKEIFKEQQMSERDKVWTQKYAHTGLPAEFYGLSEGEIRRKLNIPTAGQNSFVIIPGLVAIDGPLWDTMHGVNKSCTWSRAAKGSEAASDLVKKCPELQEKAINTKNYLSRKNSLKE
jgi:hypothetical protein